MKKLIYLLLLFLIGTNLAAQTTGAFSCEENFTVTSVPDTRFHKIDGKPFIVANEKGEKLSITIGKNTKNNIVFDFVIMDNVFCIDYYDMMDITMSSALVMQIKGTQRTNCRGHFQWTLAHSDGDNIKVDCLRKTTVLNIRFNTTHEYIGFDLTDQQALIIQQLVSCLDEVKTWKDPIRFPKNIGRYGKI